MIGGIYCIKFGDQEYIGQTTNFSERIRIHLYDLRVNIHTCPELQDYFNAHQLDGITITLLEIYENPNTELLLKKEREYHDRNPSCLGKGSHRFSKKDIEDIRTLRKNGVLLKDIGAQYGVTHVTVQKILSGKTYRWL